MYSENDWRDYKELYHHGILGQKWGVRNGPPYPLDANDHSASENKAGWRKSINSGQFDSSSSSSMSKTVDVDSKNSTSTSMGVKSRIDRLDYQVKNAIANTKFGSKIARRDQWTGESRFDDGTSRFVNQHDAEWQEVATRVYRDGHEGYFPAAEVIRDNPNEYKYDSPQYLRDCVKKVNPDFYKEGANGVRQNCTKCSAAMELQYLGYNVQAGRQTYPAMSDACTYWFDGVKQNKGSNFDETVDMFKNIPTGSHGQFSASYGDGVGGRSGGHAMWYIKTQDDRLEIFDGQNANIRTGSIEDTLNGVFDTYSFDRNLNTNCYQFEDAKPNWDHMAEDGVIRQSAGFEGKVLNKKTGRIVDTW